MAITPDACDGYIFDFVILYNGLFLGLPESKKFLNFNKSSFF